MLYLPKPEPTGLADAAGYAVHVIGLWEMGMKANIISGSTIAVAAIALVFAGVAPAAAKHHHHHKHHGQKHSCNAKAGCKAKNDAGAPAAPTEPMGGAK
jgi:hypothetical protein